MSLPDGKAFRIGKLQGIKYTFKEVGDGLPLHTHGENDQHCTIVTSGRIRVFGKTGERVCVPGEMIDFPAGKAHGFEALEPGSVVINIRN